MKRTERGSDSHSDPELKEFETSEKKQKISHLETQFPTDESQFSVSLGISEFTSKNVKPLFGNLKERFEDFLVNEIDTQGNVCKITNTEVPEDMKTKNIDTSKEEKLSLLEKGISELKELEIRSQILDQIQEFAKNIIEKKDNAIDYVYFDEELQKERRSRIHKIIKQYFPFVLADTATKDERRLIRIIDKKKASSLSDPRNEGGDKRGGAQKRFDPRHNAWPSDKPPYVHFLLYKENKDTIQAVNIIAKISGVKPKVFTFAGTKDKRGITVQRISARKVHPSKICQVNQSKYSSIRVGNFVYKNEGLKLGDLEGNQFTIVLRDIDQEGRLDDKNIDECFESLKKYGFINYFGLQRFGMSASQPTYKTGIHILKCEWKDVVHAVLNSRIADVDHKSSNSSQVKSLKEALKMLNEHQNIDRALEFCPKLMLLERMILMGYKKVGLNDHLGAFSLIPRNSRLLYLHAYQSYVWNHMVSKRIREYGLKVVPGDIVLENGTKMNDINPLYDLSEGGEGLDEIPETGDENATQKTKQSEQTSSTPKSKLNVKVLTKEDVQNYTIFDVLMPLPGIDIEFPKHNVGKDAYEEFMARDGISLESFDHPTKEYKSAGTYRSMLAKPHSVEYCIKPYSDVTNKLVPTDLDLLVNETQSKNVQSDSQSSEVAPTTTVSTAENNVEKRALVVKFCLGQSTYATMLIRELLKR